MGHPNSVRGQLSSLLRGEVLEKGFPPLPDKMSSLGPDCLHKPWFLLTPAVLRGVWDLGACQAEGA